LKVVIDTHRIQPRFFAFRVIFISAGRHVFYGGLAWRFKNEVKEKEKAKKRAGVLSHSRSRSLYSSSKHQSSILSKVPMVSM